MIARMAKRSTRKSRRSSRRSRSSNRKRGNAIGRGPFFVDFYNGAGKKIETRDYTTTEAAVRGAYGAYTWPEWHDFHVYIKNGGEHMKWVGRRRDLKKYSIGQLIEMGHAKGKL